MNSYFVVLREKPSVIIDRPIIINNPRNDGRYHRLCVKNHVNPSSGVVDGISYFEFVEAADLETAFGTALGELSYVSALISCVSGVSVADPEPYIAFTADDRRKHEFLQFGEFIEAKRSTGKRESSVIANLATKIEGMDDERCRNWLKSSLHVFKKSQMSAEDPYMSFILIWIAVELLDRALERELCSKPEVCSECRRQLKMTGRGLEEYLKNDVARQEKLREVARLRAKIFHRADDFVDVRNKAIEYLPFLRHLFMDGLDSLAKSSVVSLKREKSISRIGSQVVLGVDVEFPCPTRLISKGVNMAALREEDLPHFNFEYGMSTPGLREDGGSESAHEYTLKWVGFPSNAVLTPRKPHIRSMGLEVKDLSME